MIARLFIFMLSKRWGWLVFGGIIIIGGLIFGMTSHQVKYQTVENGKLIHYLVDDSNHVNMELQSGALYFLDEGDFSPTLNAQALQGPFVTLVYDSTDTKHIDQESSNTNAHLLGDGAAVVELISFDDNGQNPKTFMTSEYSQNPNGFYKNSWPLAIGIIIAGLLLCGVGTFVWPLIAKKRKKGVVAFGTTPYAANIPPTATQYPSVSDYYGQQGANPYGQPQPPVYPQQGANPYSQSQPTLPAQPPIQPPTPGSYDATQYNSPYDSPPHA